MGWDVMSHPCSAQATAKLNSHEARHSQQKISKAFIDDPFHCAHSLCLGEEVERAPYRCACVWYCADMDCACVWALLDEQGVAFVVHGVFSLS